MNLDERLVSLEQRLAAKQAEAERVLAGKLAEADRFLDGALGDASGRPVADVGETAFPPAALPRDTPIHAQVDMTQHQLLRGLDDAMEQAFEVRRYLGKSMGTYPSTYCETAREYLEPIVAGLPLSDAQREALLKELDVQAESGHIHPILTSLGVHLPGVGCFVNGWVLGKMAGKTPREAARTPAGWAHIVTTVSHEKWGHGFITELTALGEEKKSLQLGMHGLADQFKVKTVDTPDHIRLMEQNAILFESSQYVEEGFATWVARQLAERLARAHDAQEGLLDNAPTFEIARVVPALRSVRGGEECADALTALFAPGSLPVDAIHAAMRGVQRSAAAMGEGFAQACGLPAPYVLGYCLCARLAERHGRQCVPYAVAAACNIQYDLANISNHDLRSFVENQPTLNVNTRLALMMSVSQGAPNDIAGFLNRVRDELAITPPEKRFA